MLELARPVEFSHWLATLGVLCAGNMTADDAKTKIAAYKGLLHPCRGVLTQETLDKAGRTFKWFPTYGEVAELLASEEREIRHQLNRAKQIRDWKPKVPEPKEARPVTSEEVDAILAKRGWTKRNNAGQLETARPEPKRLNPIHVPGGPGSSAAESEARRLSAPVSTVREGV